MILIAAGLGFLGLVCSRRAEWVLMISSGRSSVRTMVGRHHAGLAIFIVSLGVNLLGAAARCA